MGVKVKVHYKDNTVKPIGTYDDYALINNL